MIDDTDLKIIELLEENGRYNYVAIAEKLGLVEGTIRKRVNRLIESDVIKIAATPDPRKLGLNIIAIMGLQVQVSAVQHVTQLLKEKPNIQWLGFVTGRFDLMAIVIARSTEELSRFIEHEIASIPSIIRTETFVNLTIIKGLFAHLSPLIRKIKKYETEKTVTRKKRSKRT